jgi:hypothetical protein
VSERQKLRGIYGRSSGQGLAVHDAPHRKRSWQRCQ